MATFKIQDLTPNWVLTNQFANWVNEQHLHSEWFADAFAAGTQQKPKDAYTHLHQVFN